MIVLAIATTILILSMLLFASGTDLGMLLATWGFGILAVAVCAFLLIAVWQAAIISLMGGAA